MRRTGPSRRWRSIYSITRPLSMGTFFSALAAIAGPELLDHASAIEATSLNLAVIIGPALAGALAGIIGAASTVEVQAGLTLLVAGLVAVNPAFEARSGRASGEHAPRPAHRAAGAGQGARPAGHLVLEQPGELRVGPHVHRLPALRRADPAQPRPHQRLPVGRGGGRLDPRHVRAARPAGAATGRVVLRDPRPLRPAVAAGGLARHRHRADRAHRLPRGARVLGHDRAASASHATGGTGPGDDHAGEHLPAHGVRRRRDRRHPPRPADAHRRVRRRQPDRGRRGASTGVR